MIEGKFQDLKEAQDYILALKTRNGSLESQRKSLKFRNNTLQTRNKSLEAHISDLQARLQLALFRKFGRSSEKVDSRQLELFGEAELMQSHEEPAQDEDAGDIVVPAHKRKKRGRKGLSPDLPREEIIHDISEEDKICGCGCGLECVGREESERLVIIPERVIVHVHVYLKWACRNCEGSGDEQKPVFRMAPSGKRLLPGSICSAALLAFILVNKFMDHLPFYRQEKRFARIGVGISRQDMSNWTIRAYQKLQALEEAMVASIREGPIIQMDETPVNVLREPDRPRDARSYMWLARGGVPGKPVVSYRYHPTRSGAYVGEFLEGCEGYVQTDGYSGYSSAFARMPKEEGSSRVWDTAIRHVGCLAHVRRKFYEATRERKSSSGGAGAGLAKIGEIYRRERCFKEEGLEGEALFAARQQQVKPLLEDFGQWLDTMISQVRPSSSFGKAVQYAHGQWEKVQRYIESPYLEPDNNATERAIRPFVLGRKNWLFSGSPRGARASCFFYSLLETARENGLNPYGYLKWVFEQAPTLRPDDFGCLFPWNCNREEVERFALKAGVAS